MQWCSSDSECIVVLIWLVQVVGSALQCSSDIGSTLQCSSGLLEVHCSALLAYWKYIAVLIWLIGSTLQCSSGLLEVHCSALLAYWKYIAVLS